MKSRRAKHRPDDDPLDEDRRIEERPRRGRASAPQPRRRRKLPWLLLFVLVAIAFLPTIVAKTPLRNILLSAAMPTNHIRVSIGQLSLGWFTPPAVEHVQVRDSTGDVLFQAEAITIDRTLANLLLDAHNLGQIEIVRPAVYMKLRPDGNNLEDALRNVLADMAGGARDAPAPSETSQPVDFAIKVVEGTIFAEDAATGRRWRIESSEANYFNQGAPGGIGRGRLAGRIASIDGQNSVVGTPGQFAIDIQPENDGRNKLTLQATGLSLGLADALVRRYVAGTEISGVVSGEGTATWTASGLAFPSDLATSGRVTVDQLDATAPLLAGDRVRLARVDLPWRVAAQPSGLAIEDLQLRSDVGQLAVRGTIHPASLTQSDVELRGAADLAQLAAMLPHALRIRPDTTITSGTVQLSAHTQPADGGELITGSLETGQLAAINAGRPVRWDQPVKAMFAVRRQQSALRLDSLKCDSDFLQVDASGTTEQLAATAQFDLNKLADQLGQFIDLSGITLAGTGNAKISFQQSAPDQLAASAAGELSQLKVALGEHQLATSRSNFTANIRRSQDSIGVSDAKIQAADLRATMAGWNINEPRAELAGDAHWNSATGEIVSSTAQLVTSALAVATKDVRYRGPQVSGGQTSAGQLTGMAAFRADVDRLAAWRASTQQPATYQPSGEVVGQVRFLQQGDRLTGEVNATGTNLALASRAASPPTPDTQQPTPPFQTIWQEAQVVIQALANYDVPADRLALERLQIQSNTLQATAAGRIEKLATAADVQLNGTLDYDLAQITPLLRPYLGDGVQLTGREQAQFALAGRLNDNVGLAVQPAGFSGLTSSHWSRRVRAQMQLPWSGANIYGLPIGPGRLAATLGEGAIRVEPLALAVGEGQLSAAPNIRLDPPPSELTLPQGPLVTNVRISPEVSNAMLKFVAPVLAGATQSEGQFSMALSGARVPLEEAKRADAAGQLTVHSVRVVPGPLAKQWVSLAQQIEALLKRRDQASGRQVTLLSIKDQPVNFRVLNGRVYHENMEFQVGDVMLRSQGSVGFDETIALTLTVPIQEKWIADQPLLSGFKGQSLQIPISGTLMRPQMDQRAIASLTQQLLQGAAQQAVGGELNKALDKLFKPRQ